MPLYDYACEECEHTFEVLVFDGEAGAECPQCHGRHVNRLLSVPARPPAASAGACPLPTAKGGDLPPCGPGCCRL